MKTFESPLLDILIALFVQSSNIFTQDYWNFSNAIRSAYILLQIQFVFQVWHFKIVRAGTRRKIPLRFLYHDTKQK